MLFRSCYAPGTIKSNGAVTIPAGDSTGVFYGYYVPNGQTDTSIVEYCFNLSSNANDSICRTFSYSQFSDKELTVNSRSFTPIAFVDDKNANSDIKVYPNPSVGMINVEFSGVEGTIVIRDILGHEVYKTALYNGNQKLLLNNLNDGVYFYSIYANEKELKTERLVISGN